MQNMAKKLIPDGVWIYNKTGGFAFEGSSLLETPVYLVLLLREITFFAPPYRMKKTDKIS